MRMQGGLMGEHRRCGSQRRTLASLGCQGLSEEGLSAPGPEGEQGSILAGGGGGGEAEREEEMLTWKE